MSWSSSHRETDNFLGDRLRVYQPLPRPTRPVIPPSKTQGVWPSLGTKGRILRNSMDPANTLPD